MGTRQRAVMSLSLSPDTAKEYKEIAKTEGKTISGLFREMFFFYKQEKLKKEFQNLTRPCTSLREFFRQSPLYDTELDLERSKDVSREILL